MIRNGFQGTQNEKNHIAGLTPLALVGGLLVGTTAQADTRDAAYERTVSVADGTQPYLGVGWRSSHKTGFGFFSEFGVVATDVDVSISTTNGDEENIDSGLRDDIQAEEKSLEDDIDRVSVFPVAVLGISYTF